MLHIFTDSDHPVGVEKKLRRGEKTDEHLWRPHWDVARLFGELIHWVHLSMGFIGIRWKYPPQFAAHCRWKDIKGIYSNLPSLAMALGPAWCGSASSAQRSASGKDPLRQLKLFSWCVFVICSLQVQIHPYLERFCWSHFHTWPEMPKWSQKLSCFYW